MTTVFDERWFERLRLVTSLVDDAQWFQNYSKITKAERDLFVNNEIENPQFHLKKTTPNIDGENEIDTLLLDMHQNEKQAIVLELYERKLHNHRLRSQLITASQTHDDKAFFTVSSELYGKPKKKYFAYVAKRVTKLADTHAEIHPAAAKRIKKVMSKIDFKSVDISADILPPTVTGSKEITTIQQAVGIFKNTLDRLQITDWEIIVDETDSRSRFSVNAYQKIIYIPGEAKLLGRPKKMTRVQLEALAEHEVGVHARRSYEGANSQLLLLQTGLDHYLPGEEGLAGYCQQQIEGADEFYGFDRYLAACLATGMDGLERDFRSVFSLMSDYYTLRYTSEAGKTSPLQAAWEVTVRTFRGTTGQTAGTIYTKDISYMEGNIGIWHLISDKPTVFESLFIGKYNPLIARHVRSLQTLEILKEW